MPRFSGIRTSALSQLAEQLRFAPRSAVSRQARAVIELARDIDPAGVYTEDWVVSRITGYRPRTDDHAVIAGEALLADLSAFLERISSAAKLRPEDAGPRHLTIDQLRARWSVSARTLERYRRLGLLAMRVRADDGRERLVFPEHAVIAFEPAHADRLRRAAATQRLTPELRERILRRARRYRDTLGLPPTRIAERLAARFAVSPGAVRRALLSDPLAFPSRVRIRPAALHRAWRLGVTPARLARRHGRTRASVHRIIDQRRTTLLRSLTLAAHTEHPTDTDHADDAPLRDTAARLGLGEPGERTPEDFARAARAQPPPDPRREHALAAALHFLRRRADAAIRAMPHPRAPAGLLDQAETDLRWAALLKIELARSLRPLILRTVEDHARAPLERIEPSRAGDLLHAAFAAAADAIDRFDPSRGGRLAAPVSLALARRLSAPAAPAPPRREPTPADWAAALSPWQRWLEAPPTVRRAVEHNLIPPDHALILRRRFGWSIAPPATAETIRQEHGADAAALARILRAAARAGAAPPTA
jgi:hypothetical protein